MNPPARQNRLRVPAVVYRRNPKSGAPEYELLQLAAGVTGHRTVEDFVRWAALIQAQRAVKFAMERADDKLEQQQEADHGAQDEVGTEVEADVEAEAGDAGTDAGADSERQH